MRAACYAGERRIELADLPPVPPGPGEVEIAVAWTGICGTDLHVLHGDMDARVTLPAVLGHETAGRIAALGPGVTGWAVGDPVTVMPLRWCGHCPACRAGYGHVCPQLDFLGIDAPGSMQQRWTVPADLLVRLPPELSLRAAALVEPTAVAVHDVGRAALLAGETAVVVGGGPVGVLVACVARAGGADVAVCEVDPFRRGFAARLGLPVLDPVVDDVVAWAAERTDGAGAAVAFEVSGAQAGLDTALSVLGVRGRLVLVGIHPQPRPVDLFRVFWRELTLLGARVYQRADVERAVELVAAGAVPAAELVSRVVPLDAAGEAFALLDGGGGEVMKVLVGDGPDA